MQRIDGRLLELITGSGSLQHRRRVGTDNHLCDTVDSLIWEMLRDGAVNVVQMNERVKKRAVVCRSSAND